MTSLCASAGAGRLLPTRDARPYRYAIGLGSNRRHGRHGPPARVLQAAVAALAQEGLAIGARASVITTTPLGPGGRAYANSAVLVSTPLDPAALLALVKRVERAFGRRRGRRWGARVLDVDILLWSGGQWHSRELQVPHRALSARAFVLRPLREIAPDWRLPGGATIRQLAHCLRAS